MHAPSTEAAIRFKKLSITKITEYYAVHDENLTSAQLDRILNQMMKN
jgi:hypothetical protein